MIMDKATIELLARPAGLDKALAEFPEDVAAAAKQSSGSVAKGQTRRLWSARPSPSDGWGVSKRWRLWAGGAATSRDDRSGRGRVARFRHPALRQRNGPAQ